MEQPSQFIVSPIGSIDIKDIAFIAKRFSSLRKNSFYRIDRITLFEYVIFHDKNDIALFQTAEIFSFFQHFCIHHAGVETSPFGISAHVIPLYLDIIVIAVFIVGKDIQTDGMPFDIFILFAGSEAFHEQIFPIQQDVQHELYRRFIILKDFFHEKVIHHTGISQDGLVFCQRIFIFLRQLLSY